MARAILFNIPSTGHVNPSLPLVRELVERGEDILYVNTEDYRASIEKTGCRFVRYPDLHELEYLIKQSAGAGNLPRNMRDLLRITAHLTPYARELIQREQPDYVIYDSLTRWAHLAVRQAGLPSISLNTTFIVPPRTFTSLPPATIADTFSKLIRVLPSYVLDTVKMIATQGIYPGFLIDAVSSMGDKVLVFTSRTFQPSSEQYGDRFKFVGISIDEHLRETVPFEWPSSQPLVYISLGTLAQNPQFLKRSFEAFAHWDRHFLVSVGRQNHIEELGSIPSNFTLASFVPQMQVLEGAEAFITHGGLNSVQEALINGVPMLAVPQQIEQALVAQELAKHGAGIALRTSPPFDDISAAELDNGLKRLLSTPTFAEHARTLGETLINAGGYQRAADEIIDYVAQISSS